MPSICEITVESTGITITGKAFKDVANTIPYNLDTEVISIEFRLQAPINGKTTSGLVGIITNPGTGGNDFHWKDPSNSLNIDGYWGIEPFLTLTSGEIIPLGMIFIDVCPVIPASSESQALAANTLTINGQSLLLGGIPLVLE